MKRFTAALCLIVSTVAASGSPAVTRYANFNNAYGVARNGKDSTHGTVIYLDTFDDTDDCEAACLDYTDRCWSFVHLVNDTIMMNQCFAVLSPGWNPSYDPGMVSATVDWDCRDDEDCSLNGACGGDGECVCRAAWSGQRCETLNLLPTSNTSGYRGTDDGHNTSSWGGAVLPGTQACFFFPSIVITYT